ncbi:hypothetical protein [Dyadobacter soli]|uniref:hypothetical protein n=1 Tax=Dyadobacter soli TaxID=659014 RepID=UPI00115F7E7E|nr:hypothetical protein [Dyadobacter soli]
MARSSAAQAGAKLCFVPTIRRPPAGQKRDIAQVGQRPPNSVCEAELRTIKAGASHHHALRTIIL